MRLLGGRTWRRFLAVSLPFFRGEARWWALGVLGFVIGLKFAITGLNVINSFVGCHFITAIAERETDRFIWLAALYAGVFVASTIVAVLAKFVEERFGLRWREWLTRHLVDKYLARHAYYRMNSRSDVDNPDQRIADDANTFTTAALSFFLIAVNSMITLCSFAGILWSITPWLFITATLYAVFGTLTTVLLGRRLVGLDVVQLKREADLRYELIQVRSNAESVALVRGEPHEKRRIGRRLAAVVQNAKSVIALNRTTAFFTVGFEYMTQLIPTLVVAPLYIRGEIEFGQVTQAAMAFTMVMGAFSLIVKEFKSISAFGAVIERVGTAWEVIEQEHAASRSPGLEVVEDDGRVAFERLTLRTPRDARPLVKELSVEVPRGKRLLVTGPHGSGRTALLRAVAGLWSCGQGRVVRPPLDEVMFLPQQP
jgi:putative ATP-binding cassette transporter